MSALILSSSLVRLQCLVVNPEPSVFLVNPQVLKLSGLQELMIVHKAHIIDSTRSRSILAYQTEGSYCQRETSVQEEISGIVPSGYIDWLVLWSDWHVWGD
ncbi:hypothetical protein BJV74DRAFT_794944 [Russula compacta]|nr:hypothetical protein BJV74DRAFT_794944 [Russula compacta]